MQNNLKNVVEYQMSMDYAHRRFKVKDQGAHKAKQNLL